MAKFEDENYSQAITHVCGSKKCGCERTYKEKLAHATKRECLACQDRFLSFSRYNRICDRCKNQDKFKFLGDT